MVPSPPYEQALRDPAAPVQRDPNASTSPTVIDLTVLDADQKSVSDASPTPRNDAMVASAEKIDLERNVALVESDNVLANMAPARKSVLLLCFVSIAAPSPRA